jgi:Transglutaminase-like superfamily
MDARIKYLAKKVRESVENWVKYRPNHEIETGTLLGACAVASYCLWQVLKYNGIKSKLVVGQDVDGYYGHSWVEINNYVIDLTSSQFGPEYPKVLIRPKSRCNYLKSFEIESYDEYAIEIFSEWQGQSHLLYMTNIEKLIKELTPN